MRKSITIIPLFVLLLVPATAFSQSVDRIVILDNLGTYQQNEGLFVFGQVASVNPDAFLIMQIINPEGDLCQIQQITPLTNGVFITDSLPLSGNICGLQGTYDVKLFYGDYTKSSSFVVSGTSSPTPSESQLFDKAQNLITEKIQSVSDKTGLNLDTYIHRQTSAVDLNELEYLYADLWMEFLLEDEIFEIDPIFRPAVTASLDSVEKLLESGEISFDISKQFERLIFSSVFHYEIDNLNEAITTINDVFLEIKNIDPIKSPESRQLTFSELEEALLNLMKKTDTVMSKDVKEELAFILARGTAPIFSDDISDLVDLLSKARYLDVVSRKDTSLYRLVHSEWDSTKNSLVNDKTISELLESKDKIDALHESAILLRQLDKVDRFISSDNSENSGLAEILYPQWVSLESTLEFANSTDDILNAKTDIENMQKVLDISSRLSKSVELSRIGGVSAEFVSEWEDLLDAVDNATSITEILEIVSTFEQSMTELREKRNPLVSLKFEFEQLKQKAELQADYENLFLINNALKTISLAEKLEKEGTSTPSKLDRIEVMLTWASEIAPSIRFQLENNTQDAYEDKASEILQRAQSIENLADLSLRKNKFLPGYIDFTDSMKEKVGKVIDLVIAKDLDAADILVRELFSEWQAVSVAYSEDPKGSENGYSLDEIQRIKYREQLENYSAMVTTFYNNDFAERSEGYYVLVNDVHELLDYGNFIDADNKVKEVGEYLSENLVLRNPRIIYDIYYDQEREIWTITGSLDKPNFDRREKIEVTIYDMNGMKHNFLKFTDTRQGDFFTQWVAPAEPGLYVAMLQYQNLQASQIINIVDKSVHVPRAGELDATELSREFEELQKFIREFGGANVENNSRLSAVIADIKFGLANRNSETVDEKLDELQDLIERYLPVRSRAAVIETQYDRSILMISGAVQKTLAFSEDLYVDIYDQQGNLVDSVALKDSASGMFDETVSIPFDSGTHVAQLEYHDVVVTDFFTVP